MLGLLNLPAPSCVRSHVVPGALRMSPGISQLQSLHRAQLSSSRQPRLCRSHMQPVAAAAAAAAAAPVDEEAKAAAFLRFQRGSPHKVRRVLDVIRGKSYEEALILLEYMPYRACEPVLNTLISAAANAKNNMGMRKAKLYVSECNADAGPVLKRIRPRAKGRGARILKPTFHLTVKVSERS